jgi:hypothetical protein
MLFLGLEVEDRRTAHSNRVSGAADCCVVCATIELTRA